MVQGLSGLHLLALQSAADRALFPLVASLGAGCVAGLLHIGMLAGSLQNLSSHFLTDGAETLDVAVLRASRHHDFIGILDIMLLEHRNNDILGSLAAAGAGGAANTGRLTSCISQKLGLAVDMLGSVHSDFLVAAEPLLAVGAPNTGGVANLGAGGILLLDSLLVCVVGGIHALNHLVFGDIPQIFGRAALVLADIQFFGVLGAGSVFRFLVYPCMLAGAAKGGKSLLFGLRAALALVYLIALGLTGCGNVSLVVFNLHSEAVAQLGVIFVIHNSNALIANSAENLIISAIGAVCVMMDRLTGGMV